MRRQSSRLGVDGYGKQEADIEGGGGSKNGGSSSPASSSFARDLCVHTLFALVLLALIVSSLGGSRKRATATVVDMDALESLVSRRREAVATMKRSGTVMETDRRGVESARALQNATRRLLKARYGPGPTYKVALRLQFPKSMGGDEESLVVETASLELMPHAVHVFLDSCVTRRSETWSGAFHRNAGHVLQAYVKAEGAKGLAYQEYSPDFPHKKYTLGFAGRPGGPEFYISTIDNVLNHGPGSQGSKTEADSCFAKVSPGYESVVERMRRQPAPQGLGFVKDPSDFIRILRVEMLS